MNKSQKSLSDIDENMESKTSQVIWLLQNRVATIRIHETTSSAAVLAEMIGMFGHVGDTLDMDMLMYFIQKTLHRR